MCRREIRLLRGGGGDRSVACHRRDGRRNDPSFATLVVLGWYAHACSKCCCNSRGGNSVCFMEQGLHASAGATSPAATLTTAAMATATMAAASIAAASMATATMASGGTIVDACVTGVVMGALTDFLVAGPLGVVTMTVTPMVASKATAAMASAMWSVDTGTGTVPIAARKVDTMVNFPACAATELVTMFPFVVFTPAPSHATTESMELVKVPRRRMGNQRRSWDRRCYCATLCCRVMVPCSH